MREIVDSNGSRWAVEQINRGRASAYLNPRVHRPVVQFTCLDRSLPRRYAALPVAAGDLPSGMDDASLVALLERAKTH